MVAALSGAAAAERNTEPAETSTGTSPVISIEIEGEADRDPPASVSCGSANRGGIAGAVQLSPAGDGYVVPAPWLARGNQYGTAELVGLISRVGAALATQHPGSVLGVADLSSRGGGAIRFHHSHQSGRDVDLQYFAVDSTGAPLTPGDSMPYYDRDGRATEARSPVSTPIAEHRFDTRRNWALVKALVSDSETTVATIFVSSRVKRWLLDHARKLGEPDDIIAAATMRLRHARGHHDHMHVRIQCSERDRAVGGCRDATARRPRRGRKWSGDACRLTKRSEAALSAEGYGSGTPPN